MFYNKTTIIKFTKINIETYILNLLNTLGRRDSEAGDTRNNINIGEQTRQRRTYTGTQYNNMRYIRTQYTGSSIIFSGIL